jgi:hypothetical protein
MSLSPELSRLRAMPSSLQAQKQTPSSLAGEHLFYHGQSKQYPQTQHLWFVWVGVETLSAFFLVLFQVPW